VPAFSPWPARDLLSGPRSWPTRSLAALGMTAVFRDDIEQGE